MTQLSISKARSDFLALPERLAKIHDHTIGITRNGEPVLAVLSWDFYECLTETLDVLADPKLTASLHQSIAEMEAGELIDQQEVMKRLGR
jgi:PHD/YefM family antitoxin component YafN of YafNO toxin-antitoxin module